ncbi:MAG: protein translocase subunit SecF [Myxococcota bacterium]
MFQIVRHDHNIDFMGKAPLFVKLTLASIVLSIVAMMAPGLRFGLDFSGGYEVLLAFDKAASAGQVREVLAKLDLGDFAVQSFSIPDSPKTHYLVRVQKATISDSELKSINDALSQAYGANFKAPVTFRPEIGQVVEVEFAHSSTAGGALTSSSAVAQVLASTQHPVSRIKKIGRPDDVRYSAVLHGVDITIVSAMQKSIDPSVIAVRTEFVGPTVGKQLREEGALAVFYALVIMLIYIALRFDIFYAPGAVLNVFHDAIITTGFVIVIQRIINLDFNLATVATILTLIGYSINDTIIVYDRIRETVGKAQGHALNEILNKAVNETLSRTIMTSMTVFLACICLMAFGSNTVLFDFGLIMGFGVIIGTYSSIYVAAPIFKFMRERFGPKEMAPKGMPRKTGGSAQAES